MATILDRILEKKKEDLAEVATRQQAIEKAIKEVSNPLGFKAALARRIAQGQAAVIAEFKRKSPSKGIIREGASPSVIAQAYAPYATALSVLTERHFFGGANEDLQKAKQAANLPILRKDFIIDPLHVLEARAIGADAVLLIVAILDRQSLRELAGLAHKLDLSVLIEVHDEAELEEALCLDEAIIGINNRDLRSFEVSLQTSIRLRRLIPENRLVVAESGIHTPEDIRILRENGLHAFLIGESLMKAESPTEKLKELLAVNLH
jgi:indole-3-glycerol phosphate synthase